MMTRKRKIILLVAALLSVPLILISGITNASMYLSKALVNNSQGPLSSLSTNTGYSNWTGSIQVSKTLSQIIQSQVHTTLGNAATSAEKLIGTNSHATSANLREERGYLVYTVLVKDNNDNDDEGQQHYDHEHGNNNVAYEYHHHNDDYND